MKIVFMGTPDIAVPALESLIKAGHEITAVITQPDKSVGRHKDLMPSPVKVCALAHNIKVLQPISAKAPEFIEEVKSLGAELGVVMAYGQILKKDLLDAPKLGCINIHASLLPKYRGCAPISAVILNGEEKTGVTTMYMDEGIDTGDMLLSEEISISDKETTQSLEKKISEVGGRLIVETISKLEDGSLVRIKQNDEDATYVKMLKKEQGLIDFSDDATNIERKIRAFYPWPGTYTFHNGIRIKIYAADVVFTDVQEPFGKVIDVSDNGIVVATGNNAISIKELQSEGKKRMPVSDFIKGYGIKAGDSFS